MRPTNRMRPIHPGEILDKEVAELALSSDDLGHILAACRSIDASASNRHPAPLTVIPAQAGIYRRRKPAAGQPATPSPRGRRQQQPNCHH